jgi:hypothetical protein
MTRTKRYDHDIWRHGQCRAFTVARIASILGLPVREWQTGCAEHHVEYMASDEEHREAWALYREWLSYGRDVDGKARWFASLRAKCALVG